MKEKGVLKKRKILASVTFNFNQIIIHDELSQPILQTICYVVLYICASSNKYTKSVRRKSENLSFIKKIFFKKRRYNYFESSQK